MHGVSMPLDVLLPILGEIPQHVQWNHTDGDLVLGRPDLNGDKNHTSVKLIFEDLSWQQVGYDTDMRRERE